MNKDEFVARQTKDWLESNMYGKQDMFEEAMGQLFDTRTRLAAAESAIVWALGYTDFRPRILGEGLFYWRTELRERSGITDEQAREIAALLAQPAAASIPPCCCAEIESAGVVNPDCLRHGAMHTAAASKTGSEEADRLCVNCGEPMKNHVGGAKRGLCKNGEWNSWGNSDATQPA